MFRGYRPNQEALDGLLFSIIVPIFNPGQYLLSTIESVFCSDLDDWELILVEDFSTDGTRDWLLAEESKFDSRVKVLFNPSNLGEVEAVNAGFRLAGGDYVLVLSADDLIAPGLLRAAKAAFLRNREIDAVYPSFHIIDEAGTVLSTSVPGVFSVSKLLARVKCVPGPGTIFRRDGLNRATLRDFRFPIVSDYEQWVWLSLRYRFDWLPTPLASWRMHEKGATASIRSEDRDYQLQAVLRSHFTAQGIGVYRKLQILRGLIWIRLRRYVGKSGIASLVARPGLLVLGIIFHPFALPRHFWPQKWKRKRVAD